MNTRNIIATGIILIFVVLAAGCTVAPVGVPATPPATTPAATPAGPPAYTHPAQITTTPELVAFVANAASYARETGREKAFAAFNEPNGSFVIGNVHVFAIEYNGTLRADPMEPENIGTNILHLTDSFGVPLVKNMAETARFGRGYVSYSYPNPARNMNAEPEIAIVEDVDGTYFVGAGIFASEGQVYPSTTLNTSGAHPGVDDLVRYIKGAVAYARANGREKSIAVFNDPKGPFVQGELVMMAFDENGTNLASPPYSPELTKYHINLVNYHDPDGVGTIRAMRDLAKGGGGFFYTVAKVNVDGKEVYLPKIDYAEPVDPSWWIFSGIIDPEYANISAKDLAGLPARGHSRQELYDRVNQAVAFAQGNGKEKTLTEINNPAGRFVTGDLFVWAESANGTLLADPFWKAGIGKNQLDYFDRYGMKTTRVGIDAMKNGTGFSRALFPNTAMNGTTEVPKLIYMKAVDDTWWIGSGVYGIETR